jgi:hypothetical protein
MPFAICYPSHVNTLVKKVLGQLVKTPKNFYGKKKKFFCWVIVARKSFLHLSHHCYNHPIRKSCPWYQVCLNGISNDNIDQCANAINDSNVNLLTRRMKERQWKNMGLLTQNNFAPLTMDTKTSQTISPPWA